MDQFPNIITAGTPFTFQLEATNDPTSWAAVGLPASLLLNTVTGQISGALAKPGVYSFQVIATNETGDSAPMFVFLEVSPPAAGVVVGAGTGLPLPWLTSDLSLTDLQFDLAARGVASNYALAFIEGDTLKLAILLLTPAGQVNDATTIWFTARTDADTKPVIDLSIVGADALTTVDGGEYYLMPVDLTADPIVEAINALDDPGAGVPAMLTLWCQLAVLRGGNTARSKPFQITITERMADAGLPPLGVY